MKSTPNQFKRILMLFFALFILSQTFAQTLPVVSGNLGMAKIYTKGDSLFVSTGEVQRVWVWTPNGLITTCLKDLVNRKTYQNSQNKIQCDWNFQTDKTPAKGKLLGMTTNVANDDSFTNKYLELVAEIRYESLKLDVRYIIWAFPDAPGIRTQLQVKALPGFDPKTVLKPDTLENYYGSTQPVKGARTEFLPLDLSVRNERRYWGYYNDPGNRCDQSKDMLREEVVKGFPVFQDEAINWASGIAVEYGDRGVCLVKESNKCVNQQGHNTGSFYSGPAGLSATGSGLLPGEIVSDRFRECWANWTIIYSGGNDGLQLALKRFDRARYPVYPERDLFIIGNTWGPANPLGDQFTEESFVLKEIPALAKLGVDRFQIDDGWQRNGNLNNAREFLPKYTNGWKDIKAVCDQNGIKMGLWVAIRNANVADLKHDLDELGSITWKADYDHLSSRKDFEDRNLKYREVMKHAWMKTQFTLCPEYDDPRYGWYYSKEYGSIFFQNVQEGLPEHLTMVPYHVLRQHWLMAKYFNSNKLQVMLQNPKRTDQQLSDAFRHSHSYCFAMGLPFIPVFFQSAQFLDPEGQQELKQLISVYKKYREEMFRCYTFPVGDEPSNISWSGFQQVDEKAKHGFILLFRELHNQEVNKEIGLKFLANKTIQITNLEDGTVSKQKIMVDGKVKFSLKNPAGFLFLKYEVVD